MVIHNVSNDRKGLALIAISSCLLGIWATVGTIALRNILLVIGSCIAIAYWIECLRNWINHPNQGNLSRNQTLTWIPLFLVVLMPVWVVIHYFFFSQYPDKQWDELTSTWTRASLAILMGSALGLALQRNKKWAWLLWLGLTLSFLVVLIQYVPKAIERGTLFAPDFFGGYIYWAKFNGVLAGTLLIAGLMGLAIDRLWYQKQVQFPTKTKFEKSSNRVLWVYVVLGIFIPTYSFVFIFSTKNGVAMTVALIGLATVYGAVWIFSESKPNLVVELKKRKSLKKAFLFLTLIILLIWLMAQHIKNSPGWESMIEDITISSKIDEYPNWLNIAEAGYPQRKDGSFVAGNTYERVAWGLAGFRLIVENPYGAGVTNAFPVLVKEKLNQTIDAAYTHSAWIDLGLSFGWPGLILLPLALFSCILIATNQANQHFQATVILISAAFLLLYLVGEYAHQHGIELLLFGCSLIIGLVLANSIDQPQSSF